MTNVSPYAARSLALAMGDILLKNAICLGGVYTAESLWKVIRQNESTMAAKCIKVAAGAICVAVIIVEAASTVCLAKRIGMINAISSRHLITLAATAGLVISHYVNKKTLLDALAVVGISLATLFTADKICTTIEAPVGVVNRSFQNSSIRNLAFGAGHFAVGAGVASGVKLAGNYILGVDERDPADDSKSNVITAVALSLGIGASIYAATRTSLIHVTANNILALLGATLITGTVAYFAGKNSILRRPAIINAGFLAGAVMGTIGRPSAAIFGCMGAAVALR